MLYWSIADIKMAIVSGEQWGDSAINLHIFVPPKTPLPSRLPYNIEQSSKILYWKAGLIKEDHTV